MKKIFTYLTVAALMAVACEGMYGPVETPTAPDQAGSVEIQIDTLGDEVLRFTIAPVGETSYYSYFVAKGPAAAVDSVSVYQCKKDGLVKGTFKAADVPQKTVELTGLTPDTPYTIYAVAGSPQGIPGSVAVKEVTTTDGVAIAITSFNTANDSTVVLSFSEQVFLGEGTITATYYASKPSVVAMGEVTAEAVDVEGNTATVSFAGLPHGAYFAVSYTEGTFTDSANNKIKAFASGFNAEAGKFAGVYSRKETVTFDLDEAFPEEFAMFSDWQTAVFSVGVPGGETLAAAGKGAVKANYITPGKTISIDMTLGTDYVFNTNDEGKSGVMLVCPEQPAFGTTVVFSFEDDAFQDIWGNSTNAAEYTTLCAYDYTLDDVIGTFNVSYYSYFYGSANGWFDETLTIEALEGSEGGNVQITELFGIECTSPIVATFVPTSGLLTISGEQAFGVGQDYLYGADNAPVVDESGAPVILDVVLTFGTYSGDDLVLQMSKAGYFYYEANSTGDLVGVYEYYEGEFYNYYDMIMAMEIEKAAADGGEAVAAMSSVKRPLRKNTIQ